MTIWHAEHVGYKTDGALDHHVGNTLGGLVMIFDAKADDCIAWVMSKRAAESMADMLNYEDRMSRFIGLLWLN